MAKHVKLNKDKFIKPRHSTGSIASYPAMPLTQNNQKFFLASIPAYDIFPYGFVSRRDADPQSGFQRNLNEDRALDIAKYLDNSQGSIPTNIVLSSQESAELQYNSKTKTLKYKRLPKSFLVIDGQHRLFGYGLAKKEHRIPVAIYEGLTRKNEAALFIDINTNQRGVPAALLLDIKQVAERESEIETYLRTFFDKLNEESDSPFNGFLSPSASVTGKISRVTFNRGVKIVLETPKIQDLSEQKQYILVKNYFKAVEDNLQDFKLLLKTAYFEAFCAVFDDVLERTYADYHDYKYESISSTLSKLSNVDFAGIMTQGRTKITKGTIITHLKSILSHSSRITDDLV